MRILVIDLLNIGDLLFASPALRSLREAFPEAKMDMLVKHAVVDTVRHNPNLDTVIGMDINGYHKSPAHFWELIRSLRAERYDKVINLHDSARSTLIATLCGANERLGFPSRRFGRLFHHPLKHRGDVHRVDSYLQALNELGIVTPGPHQMEMMVDEDSAKCAERKWQDAGLGDRALVIGLNPGARVPMRQWPPVKWAALADKLNASGLGTVVFGGPGETAIGEEIASTAHSDPIVFTGILSLLELACMTGKCAVFVSTDTGPLHIAVSQRTPVVALFNPANPAITGPYSIPHVIVMSNVDCPGCRGGSPESHICLASVTVDEVHDGVLRMLGPR